MQRSRFIPLIRRRVKSGRPENGIVGEHIVGRKVQTPLLASDRRAAFACDRERRLVTQRGIEPCSRTGFRTASD